MFELLVLGALGLAAAIVFGVLFSLGSLLLWVIVLPFKLLALVFRGLGVLLALPFMLLFGVLGLVIFGFGFMVFLAPAVPLLLVVAGIWWLISRSRQERTTARV